MTRVVAGTAGGRRLHVPAGRDTRPTSDRVREALFSRLEHEGLLDGTRVLDLYAGSGALGLEAASRGAREVLLVEDARAAVAAIRRNVAETGLTACSVAVGRVERVLAQPPTPSAPSQAREPFDLVLADPPYPLDEEALGVVLDLLVERGWVAEGSAVVVERASRSPEPAWPSALVRVADRSYGETRLWFAEHVTQQV